MTPEGRVKQKIKRLLDKAGAYYFMPVQAGYGAHGLDYHCALKGLAFFIEAKAPGRKPTPRQLSLVRQMEENNCPVFVIDGDETLGELEAWLARVMLSG